MALDCDLLSVAILDERQQEALRRQQEGLELEQRRILEAQGSEDVQCIQTTKRNKRGHRDANHTRMLRDRARNDQRLSEVVCRTYVACVALLLLCWTRVLCSTVVTPSDPTIHS